MQAVKVYDLTQNQPPSEKIQIDERKQEDNPKFSEWKDKDSLLRACMAFWHYA